jgi:hypothetical protein
MKRANQYPLVSENGMAARSGARFMIRRANGVPRRVPEGRFGAGEVFFGRFSGGLRAVAGPKQFQQVVRGADQLPFRAGFCDSA